LISSIIISSIKIVLDLYRNVEKRLEYFPIWSMNDGYLIFTQERRVRINNSWLNPPKNDTQFYRRIEMFSTMIRNYRSFYSAQRRDEQSGLRSARAKNNWSRSCNQEYTLRRECGNWLFTLRDKNTLNDLYWTVFNTFSSNKTNGVRMNSYSLSSITDCDKI